jgi:hypothetical protein
MSTNVIKKSLYESFVFAHLFCSRALSFMWFLSTSFPESFTYKAKTLILSFFTVKAFSFHPTGYLLPLYKVQLWKSFPSIPLAISSLYSTIWKRCEWESNHCESLGDASKVPVAAVIWSLPRVEVLMPKPPHPSSHSSSTCHNTPLLSTTTLGTSQGGGREE